MVGQKMMEAGTHASGGMGRKISNGEEHTPEIFIDGHRQPKWDSDDLSDHETQEDPTCAEIPALPVACPLPDLKPANDDR